MRKRCCFYRRAERAPNLRPAWRGRRTRAPRFACAHPSRRAVSEWTMRAGRRRAGANSPPCGPATESAAAHSSAPCGPASSARRWGSGCPRHRASNSREESDLPEPAPAPLPKPFGATPAFESEPDGFGGSRRAEFHGIGRGSQLVCTLYCMDSPPITASAPNQLTFAYSLSNPNSLLERVLPSLACPYAHCSDAPKRCIRELHSTLTRTTWNIHRRFLPSPSDRANLSLTTMQ